MRCPFCNGIDTQVTDSRPVENRTTIKRRRLCTNCNERFTTFERIQLQIQFVRKSSGEFEEFSRDKLRQSVMVAMSKRPVDLDQIEQLVSKVVNQLHKRGEKEISSSVIGEYIMAALVGLDKVAYIRFSSVYKDFQNADDFESFIAQLRPPRTSDSI